MARDINRVTLLGTVRGSVLRRENFNGKVFLRFKLSTTTAYWFDPSENIEKSRADIHKIVVQNERTVKELLEASICEGTLLYVSGQIKYHKVPDDVHDSFFTEICVKNLPNFIKIIGTSCYEVPQQSDSDRN